jgi:hypothetical protein
MYNLSTDSNIRETSFFKCSYSNFYRLGAVQLNLKSDTPAENSKLPSLQYFEFMESKICDLVNENQVNNTSV